MSMPTPPNDDYDWLKDSLVSTRISAIDGRYLVELVFTDPQDPFHCLVRVIDTYDSLKRASWFADIMRRQIGADLRDPRPNTELSDAHNLCSN